MIKNIILDLGGVIIGIDYGLTSKAFKKLGANNFDEVYGQHKQIMLFDLFETGKIPAAEFRSELQKILNIKVSNEKFDEAWSAMLLNFPDGVLDFIFSKLKTKYNTLMYSNNNEISLHAVHKICLHDTGLDNFSHCFHKIYFSHLFGYRKPDKKGFYKILDENGLRTEETLFVDDTIGHILAAQNIGLKTLHLTGNLTIFDVPKFLEL